jgi:hypothetical protein
LLEQVAYNYDAMPRPNSISLTAILMGLLITTGLVLIVAHTRLHVRAVFLALLVAIFGLSYFVIWSYWRGRNWARIAVLAWSVVSALDLITLAGHHPAKNPLIVEIWGLLGIFLIYWLNTRPIRQFFTRPKG